MFIISLCYLLLLLLLVLLCIRSCFEENCV